MKNRMKSYFNWGKSQNNNRHIFNPVPGKFGTNFFGAFSQQSSNVADNNIFGNGNKEVFN